MPPVPQHTGEEKRKTRSFVPFRRGDSARSFQDLEESGPDISPSMSRDDRPISQDLRNDIHAPSQPQPATTLANGAPLPQLPLEPNAEAVPIQPALLDTAGPPQNQITPPQSLVTHPPAASGADPISQAQQEATMAALSGDESSRNFMIRDQPIQEDESEAQLAMNNMANQLRSQAQSSGLNRIQGSMRGRRDVRNTMFIPNNQEPAVPNPSTIRTSPAVAIPAAAGSGENTLASPIQRPPAVSILHEDHTVGSDTTSLNSSRSLGGPSLHTDLLDPGLNASIVETVHSWFNESGISKSFVVGEIALAYNPTGPFHSDHETIRLQHFELLDKVAANPIYVTSIKSAGEAMAEEQAGCYTIATSPIRRPAPLVGLKYQLHLEESNLAQYSPVLVTPAWQVVEGQVSVILLYSLNPVFGNEPLTLQNVTISVNLDTTGEGTGKAVSAMMAPTQGASFRRKTSAVVWRFNDLTVKPEQERFLVRFMTRGGMPKKGTIEFKFEISGRTASGIGVEKMVAGGSKEKEKDPFADDIGEGSARGSAEERRWEVVLTRRRLMSGRYTAS